MPIFKRLPIIYNILHFWWVKTERADNNQSDWKYQHMDAIKAGLEVSETVKADTSIRSTEDNSGLSAGLVPNKTDATKVVGNTDSAKGQTEETDRQVSNKSSLEDRVTEPNISDTDNAVQRADSNASDNHADVTGEAADINKDSLKDTSNKGNSLEDSNTSLEDNAADKASVSGKEDKADASKAIETADSNNHSMVNTAEDNTNTDNASDNTGKRQSNRYDFRKYNASLTPEQRQERARKAGIASGEARRERKTLGEQLKIILAQGDNQEQVCMALFKSALSGNYKAFNSLRDTIGEMPTQKQENVVSITAGDQALLEKVSKRLECTLDTDKKTD